MTLPARPQLAWDCGTYCGCPLVIQTDTFSPESAVMSSTA